MRALVQRVSRARVLVAGEAIAEIERGMLVFVAVAGGDSLREADLLAKKIAALRIFDDGAGKMNLNLASVDGQVLCISQFTLYGEVRTGNRPSFARSAAGAVAEPLYEAFCAAIEAEGLACRRGVFGAEMQVELANDGPVTLIIDTDDLARPRRA